VALVIWIVAIALIYALTQGQAQSGALVAVVRLSALRTVVTAGQSALVEATHRLRHPAGGASPVVDAILKGTQTGQAHDPQASRDAYQALKLGGSLTIGPVMYRVAVRPDDSGAAGAAADSWQIDLTVRVELAPHATRVGRVSRQLRRRMTGRTLRVGGSMGRAEGADVHRSLYLHPDPVLEVVEP
jgi:hypothetical protein